MTIRKGVTLSYPFTHTMKTEQIVLKNTLKNLEVEMGYYLNDALCDLLANIHQKAVTNAQ